jgi:hypothetical protein
MRIEDISKSVMFFNPTTEARKFGSAIKFDDRFNCRTELFSFNPFIIDGKSYVFGALTAGDK